MVVTDRRLTTLIAVVVFFLLSISAATRPVAAMYRDFGTMPPTLTRWVFTGWVPLVLGAVPIVVVAYTLVASSLDTRPGGDSCCGARWRSRPSRC
jgi:hypothetical protein